MRSYNAPIWVPRKKNCFKNEIDVEFFIISQDLDLLNIR